MEKGINFLI